MRVAAGALVVSLLWSAPAFAQVQRTYWGLSGGFTPKWEVPDTFKPLFDADSLTFEGSEFRVGFVRSSILGGDWGVSFVRKPVSDDSTVVRLRPEECAGCGDFYSSPDAYINGVEIHRFAPFGTIKERVQIGMLFAGGVGQLKGTVRATSVTRTGTSVDDVEAKVLFAPWGNEMEVVPLGKIELAVAVILGPDLKVRASGGLDLPGYNLVRVDVVYLFGAR